MRDTVMPLGNRHSQHSFAETPRVNIQRSKFDRSFSAKDTIDFDYLNPFFVDEVLPGDTINLNVKAFIRLATQVVPVLDNMYVDFFFFFVPNRLVWDNWQKFCGEQIDPGDSIDYEIPTITVNTGSGVAVGTIYDKLGLPTDVDDYTFNALPLRGLYRIYNDWFRDQNLVDSLDFDTDDGPDGVGDYTLQKRAKKHDYFTSALPWPQKGTAVSLSLGTSAEVKSWSGNSNGAAIKDVSGDNYQVNSALNTNNVGDLAAATGASAAFYVDPAGTLYADLAGATGINLNDFRQAILVQSLLELDARGGTRYVEIIRSHFQVVSPDFRLQRSEFLSSGTIMINQHPVAQTSETSGTNYQGNLTSFSTGSTMGKNIGFTKSFTEHGYVFGLCCARGEVTYQNGLHRMWSRETRYDFFWPKLQELGEQEIKNKELFISGSSLIDNGTFGYQERYAEYRYYPSQIRGQFKSSYSSPLDVWHLSEEFSSTPSLNQTFIEYATPIERSLAVAGTYPHLLCDFWFDYKHARPMMVYGVPATLGRF